MEISVLPLLGAILLAVSGCSDWNLPACRNSYSKRGDQQAIQELTEQFRTTVALVQRKKNIMLLSEARSIVTSHNLMAMEDWVCRAQKQYGTP
jgi:hypothetical protein